MTNVYLFCLTLGFVFTVVGAILGNLLGGGDGHGDGHGDAGGAGHEGPEFSHSYEAGPAGGDVGAGHGDVADGHAGPLAWPILSPTVISFFVASFGGTGLLFQRLLGDHPGLHVPLALASALVLGLFVAWGIYRITHSLDVSRMAQLSDALGAVAEVTVSVPAKGMGEVAYESGGTRQTAPAQSADGRAYPTGTQVRILKMVDGIARVGEAPPALVSPVGLEEPTRGEPVRSRQKT